MNTAFQVLLNSKLHVDVLGRVWDLSDIDKDGMLDKDEFAVVSKFLYASHDLCSTSSAGMQYFLCNLFAIFGDKDFIHCGILFASFQLFYLFFSEKLLIKVM